jgi:hypothetical protein
MTVATPMERQRRLSGVDDMVISLTAKALTTGEVAAHLAEVYDAHVSKETISTIIDRVCAAPTGRMAVRKAVRPATDVALTPWLRYSSLRMDVVV